MNLLSPILTFLICALLSNSAFSNGLDNKVSNDISNNVSHSETKAKSVAITKAAFTKVGKIKDKDLPEVSGLAVSQRQENVYWLLNDGGNGDYIYAINEKGKTLAKAKIKGLKNRDWEDMASFKLDGKPYLLIAEVGDNSAKHNSYRLHFIKEPKAKHFDDKELELKPSWSIEFTYEDGPRDCEAVAVDSLTNQIILMSKRDKTPRIYTLPLVKKPKQKSFVAQFAGKLKHPLKTSSQSFISLRFFDYNGMPTAMDISQDGSKAVVLTYTHLFYFEHSKPSNSKFGLFEVTPVKFKYPEMPQAEAVSFDASGENILITTEKLPAPIYKLNLKKALKRTN